MLQTNTFVYTSATVECNILLWLVFRLRSFAIGSKTNACATWLILSERTCFSFQPIMCKTKAYCEPDVQQYPALGTGCKVYYEL